VEFSPSAPAGPHEVQRVFSLASAFDISRPIPPLRVVPDPEEVARAKVGLPTGSSAVVAVHISARRPAQRWPVDRFAELIERLDREQNASTLLLWSPGAADHPQHPGDDEKAKAILGM